MYEIFEIITADNQVETIEKVQVKYTVSGVIKQDIITLAEIDSQIQIAKGQIEVLGTEVKRLLVMRDGVKLEAEKVILKKSLEEA